MSGLKTAEEVVSHLTPAELGEFRQWFAEFDGQIWDDQIESDAKAGKLDFLAKEALAEYKTGKSSEI